MLHTAYSSFYQILNKDVLTMKGAFLSSYQLWITMFVWMSSANGIWLKKYMTNFWKKTAVVNKVCLNTKVTSVIIYGWNYHDIVCCKSVNGEWNPDHKLWTQKKMGSSSYQMQPSVQHLAYKVRTDRSTDPQSHYLIFLSKDGHKNSYHSRILLIGTCSLLYFLK